LARFDVICQTALSALQLGEHTVDDGDAFFELGRADDERR